MLALTVSDDDDTDDARTVAIPPFAYAMQRAAKTAKIKFVSTCTRHNFARHIA
jgi:hypothetical protein